VKRMLLLGAFLVAASGGAYALPSSLYVGLYADEARSVMSVDYGGAPTQFEVWVWWLPSERGLHAPYFIFEYPSNVTPGTIAPNPFREFLIGCNYLGAPMCVTFTDCQFDWIWSHHQTCYLNDGQPSVLEFSGVLEARNCETGYPLEPITVLNKLGLNRDAVLDVEPQAWGAIKSLYR